jgi:hypothetical protein
VATSHLFEGALQQKSGSQPPLVRSFNTKMTAFVVAFWCGRSGPAVAGCRTSGGGWLPLGAEFHKFI